MDENGLNTPKRRSPPWIIGGLVLLSLITLVMLQSSNLWKSFSIETANDTLILYGLSSLNFIAFTIFAFILLRSLIKLSRERRASILGAKIKTRLLTYFIGLSILPIIAQAGFSYLFMNRAVDRWMAQIPRNINDEARNVDNLRRTEMAQMLYVLLDEEEVDNKTMTELADKGNLLFIEVLSAKDEVLAHSQRDLQPTLQAELDQRIKNSNVISTSFSDGRRLIMVPDFRSEVFFGLNSEESTRLKQAESNIRQLGLTTLGLLTFLLIFASTWVAFTLSRNLTTPIKALAEGADEIKSGNFSYQVDVLAEDELGLLVDAFNRMSTTLEVNSIKLNEGRKYIETVLESLSTGVISFDATDRVTTINKAAIQMLKLENADFKQFSLAELVGVENRTILEKLINRAKRIGQSSEQTVLIRENTNGNTVIGENLPVALTATALPDNNGVVLVIEDLTELLQAQRASAWQEVARRMAHEIKNPLTPIQLSAERIAKKIVQNPPENLLNQNGENQCIKIVKEGTDTILREVSSLKSMVDEFSRFARLPKVKLENGSLNQIIAQSVHLYEERGVIIKVDLSEELPKIMMDEEQLKRVFVNLIENAVEAFDKSQEDKQIHIKTWHNLARDLVIAEVSDNGNGIPPSDFQKLFQPYFSTKGRGTGLGLAIVQRIMVEHGGKIKAVSNTPKGAKFIIELPTVA
ncbi:MAG: HAMP domain-containing protein [Pyrinomonadaceae bacterium]|nr:HAMP domain-containing protein [Pyrinomonadaceae bacterium]